MDETMITTGPAFRNEGFEHQRLAVLPRPLVEAALSRPGTRQLTVTDAGYFPRARGHRRVRERGARETIFILCVAGTGTVVIDGESHSLTPSTWAAIPANTPHSYGASADNPWTIWWLHARGSAAAELAQPLAGVSQRVMKVLSMDRVVALFDELVALLERRSSPAQLLAAAGVAWNLLARLTVDSILPAEGSPVERAIRYLETRVDGNIQVAELAALVGLSSSHLSALFRRSTGEGPGAFHISLKMAKARERLDTTSVPVAEVARSVGYSDPLYFSRHFRRIHGLNPSAYRAQRKG